MAGSMTFPTLQKDENGLGWIGLSGKVTPEKSEVRQTFVDGSPAVIVTDHSTYFCGTPALSYAKAAKFVPKALEEKWPAPWRAQLLADVADLPPPVQLSHPVVEAGLYEHPDAAALVLGNFTYQPIDSLEVTCAIRFEVKGVRSAEHGTLAFTQDDGTLRFKLPLGISDIIRIE